MIRFAIPVVAVLMMLAMMTVADTATTDTAQARDYPDWTSLVIAGICFVGGICIAIWGW